MPYTKTVWSTKDTITAAKLNNLETQYDEAKSYTDNHINNTSNPHGVTAAQVAAVAKSGDTMTGKLNLLGRGTGITEALAWGNSGTIGSNDSGWDYIGNGSFIRFLDTGGFEFDGYATFLKDLTVRNGDGAQLFFGTNSYMGRNDTNSWDYVGQTGAFIRFKDAGGVQIYGQLENGLGQRYYDEGNITSGTSTPSGGVNGDIYIQY